MKKKTTIGERVLAALKRNVKGLSSDALAKRVGAKTPSVSSACSRLAHKGKIKRTDGNQGRGTEAVWISI